jgi:hypothetical protein
MECWGYLEHLWAYWSPSSPLSHSYCLVSHSSEIESHPVHCIKLLIFEALGRQSSDVVLLVTLGGCRLLHGLVVVPRELFNEDSKEVAVVICERRCACLTRAVKSNSSGIEVWEIHLPIKLKRSSRVLIEEWLGALNPPQCGLEVIDKSSTPRKKSPCPVSSSPCWFASFLTSLYLLVHILMIAGICCSWMFLYI